MHDYLNRFSKYSNAEKQIINQNTIAALETKISDLLLQYPQDIALPENINNKYLTYSLLQFELRRFDFATMNIISWEQAWEIAKAGDMQMISQAHDLTVEVVSKDGTKYLTKEAKIDDFIKLKEVCGEECKNIPLATE